MQIQKTAFLICAAFIGTSSVYASDFSVGLGSSTFGVTLTPTYSANDHLDLRGVFGYLGLKDDITISGTPMNAKLDIGGVGLLADFYPSARYGFHMSAGAMLPIYRYSATSNNVNFEIEGNNYNIPFFESYGGSRGVSPYVGLGYQFGHSKKAGWSGGIDIGVLPNVSYEANYRYDPGNLTQAEQDIFEDELDAAHRDGVREANRNGDILPFVAFNIRFRF